METGAGPSSQAHSSTSNAEHDLPQQPGRNYAEPQQKPKDAPKRRRYGPRQCRICLDVVEPTFPAASAPGMAFLGNNQPKPTYVSEDPEAGRLISPCICKGSQKYVHEGCIQAWRATSRPNERNYMQCPTCKFKYRTDRVAWATYLSSRYLQAVLTLLLMAILVFLLGFIADPIINLWLEPGQTFSNGVGRLFGYSDDDDLLDVPEMVEPSTWLDHFLKGLAALGISGFAQVMAGMSPWHWNSLRGGGYRNRRRRGGTGRERVEAVSYGIIIIGILTFMVTVWKFVGSYVNKSLRAVSDRILDVQGDEDGEEEQEGQKED
jgi:hypothetical protein